MLNNGTIAATDAPAVIGDEASSRIVNGVGDDTATISSNTTAILLAPLAGNGQAVTNGGTIGGGFNGVDFQGAPGASGKVFNTGLITSDRRAVNIGGDDFQLVNDGLIHTSADPRNGVVYTDTRADDATIVNAETGSIDAGPGNNGDAVSLQVGNDVDLSLSNAGTIHGRGEAAGSGQASGVRVLPGVDGDPGFNGTSLNAGLIASEATSGISAGFLIEDGIEAQGQLINEGTITGPWNGV